MENKDLQGIQRIKDYHVEAAKKSLAYAETEGMRPNDKKHYEKRAKEHLDMADVLQALIWAPHAPTTVDLANADADGYRNGRESVVVELPMRYSDERDPECQAYNDALDLCKTAIIAAGGSVKE